MKIVNKNFPSNNSYFSEPKEHLYLHKICINLLADGNGIIYFNLYSNNSNNFTDMNYKDWELFLKTLSFNSTTEGVQATGIYQGKVVVNVSAKTDSITIKSFDNDIENDDDFYGKEYFIDTVIQIY